jgi:hypothetical protein
MTNDQAMPVVAKQCDQVFAVLRAVVDDQYRSHQRSSIPRRAFRAQFKVQAGDDQIPQRSSERLGRSAAETRFRALVPMQ